MFVQVTESKSLLDKALKLSRKLNKEVKAVAEFLKTVNKQLDEREGSPGILNLEEDLTYVKVKLQL